EVDEPRANTDVELASLRRAARDLGLKGIYYANRGFLWDHFEHSFDDRRFDEFWSTVADLKLAVFWEIAGAPLPTEDNYLQEIDRLVRWQARYPTIKSVLTHGLSPQLVLNP